jgi:DNA-binding CsgD family transcriptional regulator
MARLSHKDFDLLQKAILELYEFRDANLFQQQLPTVIIKVFHADHANLSICNIDPVKKTARLATCVETCLLINGDRARIDATETLVPVHPFTKYFMEGGAMMAVKMSDFLSLNQLKNSLFWDWMKLLQVRHSLTLPVSSKQGVAAVTVSSAGRDFTERDRLMLNLLAPHIHQAQRNAELATARLAARTRPLVDYGLTPRESEIAEWLAQGKTNPEIAIILQARQRTVEKHVEKILLKLGVENRTAAATMITLSDPRGHETGWS